MAQLRGVESHSNTFSGHFLIVAYLNAGTVLLPLHWYSLVTLVSRVTLPPRLQDKAAARKASPKRFLYHPPLCILSSLAPFGIDVTIPSVALGTHLTVVDLQNDGCERVSREEEEAALRVCQAVNR